MTKNEIFSLVHLGQGCKQFIFFHPLIFSFTMKAATLAVVCVFMTLALALTASGMGYGSYMPYYGGGYGGSKGGLGDGGLCKLGIGLSSEPPHDKTNKMTIAPSEDSDQPPSLIRVFAVRMKKHWVHSCQ